MSIFAHNFLYEFIFRPILLCISPPSIKRTLKAHNHVIWPKIQPMYLEDIGEFKFQWKLLKVFMCSFSDIQVWKFCQFLYMEISFPYKDIGQTLNLIFSKTTHRTYHRSFLLSVRYDWGQKIHRLFYLAKPGD